MSIEFDGLDDVQKKLAQYIKMIEKMGGKHEFTLDDLFTDPFMQEYTNFETLQQMADASGIQSVDEIDSPKWDGFVSRTTRFSSWDEMKQFGVGKWLERKSEL